MPSYNQSEFKNWKAGLLSFAPFIILIMLLILLREAFNLPVSEFDIWFEIFRQSEFVIPIIITSFIAGSFIGLPQWALFVGVIAVFGPVQGGLLAWVSTVISASVNFAFGRWFGRKYLERTVKAKGRAAQFMVQLRENGFYASFAVRFIPTGPFIVVNALAGASGLRYRPFIGGTSLGIIPKILVVALLAQGLLREENRIGATLFFISIACFIVIAVWVLRRKLSLKPTDSVVDKI